MVTYCADETDSFDKSLKTGKRIANSVTGAKNYVRYLLNVQKSTKGVWQTTSVTSHRGACTP